MGTRHAPNHEGSVSFRSSLFDPPQAAAGNRAVAQLLTAQPDGSDARTRVLEIGTGGVRSGGTVLQRADAATDDEEEMKKPITSAELDTFGDKNEDKFRRDIFDMETKASEARKGGYVWGVPKEDLQVVAGKEKLHKSVVPSAQALMAKAKAALKEQQAKKNALALTVSSPEDVIGVTSAYRAARQGDL